MSRWRSFLSFYSFLPSIPSFFSFFLFSCVSPINLCVRTFTHCSCSVVGPLGVRVVCVAIFVHSSLAHLICVDFCLIYSASWNSFLVCFAQFTSSTCTSLLLSFLSLLSSCHSSLFCFALRDFCRFLYVLNCFFHPVTFSLHFTSPHLFIFYSAVRCSSCVFAVDNAVFECHGSDLASGLMWHDRVSVELTLFVTPFLFLIFFVLLLPSSHRTLFYAFFFSLFL